MNNERPHQKLNILLDVISFVGNEVGKFGVCGARDYLTPKLKGNW